MSLFLVNIILALIWVGLTAKFNTTNILFGFMLAFFILIITSSVWDKHESYAKKVWVFSRFLFSVLTEIIFSSFRIALDVLRPTISARPGIIAFPLSTQNEIEVTVLGILISLTPGSLTIEVSPDQTQLFVHIMYANRSEKELESMKRLEQRVIELLR